MGAEPGVVSDPAAPASSGGLVRIIGRWTLVGLTLNAILGSGVYGLPSVIGGRLGSAAWWSWLVAALVIGAIMACAAEVASRFGESGGPYLYARVAFGGFVGVQMGWLSYLVRLTAAATNANLLVIYLAEFVPAVGGPVAGGLALVAVFATLALMNYRGVKQGAMISNVFIVSKVVPLLLFGVIGCALILVRGAAASPGPVQATAVTWMEVILMLVYAYGGFEAALVPLAEARRPQVDAPFALFTALFACVVIYTLVQVVVSLTLPDAASHPRPLADAAGALIGPAGATFMTVGALLSLVGYLAASTVNVPRLTYAMAERGDFPAAFGRIHRVFRTPHVSIVFFAVASTALALSGSFLQNLTLSAVSRLATYGLICLAVPALRRRTDVPPAAFRLPGGTPIAIVGVIFSLLLATRMTSREGWILAIVVLAAGINWWLARRARA